ncbi:MAG: thiamine pyrophosphate-binding protein [Candidatus Thiodiazotropha sp.]
MKIKVSELIVGFLKHLGVDVIYGMPGAHILPVYDALYDSGIRAVLAKHEQGAAFMAGGYARATGRISACIATAGPGATNLITGVANAFADNQPVLVITGETPTYLFGKGGLQESSGEGGSFDQVALFAPITRYCKSIQRTDYLGQVLIQAAKALRATNPGPVLLSIPFNVQNEWVESDLLKRFAPPAPAVDQRHSQQLLNRFIELLDQANHPVIVAGYGAIRSGARQPLTELSNLLRIPVASSLKGKGVINEQSELSLGSLGVTSSGIAYRYIVENADLLIILGASFNERTSYLWDPALLEDRRIIQIDSDPHQLGKVLRTDLEICDDIHAVLTGLIDTLQQRNAKAQNRPQSIAAIEQMKSELKGDYTMFRSGFSLVEHFFSRLGRHFTGEIRVFDDNMIFAQNFYDVPANHHYFPNSGISSLGHALPAALGAQFGAPLPSFAVLGDGGFQMCCMELMTAVNYAQPMNVVVFNNGTMGLIRKNQHQLYGQRYLNCDFVNPDFARLAESFGIQYKAVYDQHDLDDLFDHYDLENGLNLIDIALDKNAFPNYSSKR